MLQQALNPLAWLALLHLLLWLGISARVLLRRDLSADVRVAWLLVLLLLPYGGVLLYFLFGEVYLGRALARQQTAILQALGAAVRARADWAHLWGVRGQAQEPVDRAWQAAFTYAASVHGFAATAGNSAELLADEGDGAPARSRLLADLDAAQQHIHLLYYIWLPDHTGQAVAQALIRAAQRGVLCRVLVDALGSRLLLQSPLWSAMQAAGVQAQVALPFRWWQPLRSGRVDVRNHRKICVIDGQISHMGSQNCADAAFAIKAKYAPWVDIMLRVQGPVVAQNQLLFISDWLLATGQTFEALAPTVHLPAPASASASSVVAQIVAAGPASRPRSTAQFLVTLLASAQKQLWISTPYFVPDATVLQALCAAAWRGVDVRLILPARNDAWVVAAASRSHYAALLQAGVQIFEYAPGLLHAKTLTVDGQLSFLGSTNIDMRSFGLNYENNVLLQDAATTAAIMQRQQGYMQSAQGVAVAAVQAWSRPRRIWNNVLAALSPLL